MGTAGHKVTTDDGKATVVIVDDLMCDHCEADTHLILHCQHASHTHSTVVIRSPDSDVAMIALSRVRDFPATVLFETGVKEKARVLNLSILSEMMGTRLGEAILGLHTFTGCDSVSAFHGKGKKKALDIISRNEDYQAAFRDLGQEFMLPESACSVLEQFVCQLYGQSCSSVDEAQHLFCTKALCEQSLPPTADALRQHSKRANYQSVISR